MDKCIKVLIPTGEVRLIDVDEYLTAADDKSGELMDKFFEGGWSVLKNSDDCWVGDWVEVHDEVGSNLFPVITQYGDEFPV